MQVDLQIFFSGTRKCNGWICYLLLFSTLWRLLVRFENYPLLLVAWIDHISWPLCLMSQMYALCTNHSCGIYWSVIAFWKLHVRSLIFTYQACHPPTSSTKHLDVKCFLPCSSNQYPSSIYDSSVGGILQKLTGFYHIFIYVF